MSSLNVTVENKIFISYIKHKMAVNSHGGKDIVMPNVSVSVRHQHTEESLETTAGLCSVFMEAPPGRVLSLLFMNQTCSPYNHVQVYDIHDGWSTTLDGCSPWISPGYDVTTSSRSAVTVINLHNTTDFFRLDIQITAVTIQRKDEFIIRYVSPVLGYIQTLDLHPFARSFKDEIKGYVIVAIPLRHVTLISVVIECLYYTGEIKLFARNRKRHRLLDVLRFRNYIYVADVVLLVDFSEFYVQAHKAYEFLLNNCFRVMFSFHTPLLAPQRLSNRLWNCSVPFWQDFSQHFVCNRKTECANGGDEMWCPDTYCQQGGILLNKMCYTFISLPKEKNTWHHANTACKQRGAALATFRTGKSWFNLAVLRQTKRVRDLIYIGLQSPDVNYPHMYRYLLQWYNGSISHYSWVSYITQGPPNCVYQHNNFLRPVECAVVQDPTTFALCQVMSSSSVGVFRKDNGKYAHRSTKQIFSSGEQFPVPSIICPYQHRTQDFLAYDDFSACCHDYDVRSSGEKITSDNTVKSGCVGLDVTFKALFRCQIGTSYVPYSLVCNHLQDCADNSDEDLCVFPPCSAVSLYKCGNGQCLHVHQHCDEIVQCVDESDETDCTASDFRYGRTLMTNRPPAVADFDGRGWMVYRPLTKGKYDSVFVCPDAHWLCQGDIYCLPVYIRCNGLYDCPGLEDEIGCDSYTCPGFYRCRGSLHICLYPEHLCDGWPQCPQHDDEVFCNLTCPVSCTCLGHAFTCYSEFHVEPFSSLRYLDAGGTGLGPERLANNKMLVYLSLAKCDLAHLSNLTLPNLLTLDLSDNRFSVVTVAELKLMKNLRNLYLARNPLSKLFSGNVSSRDFVHKGILHIDLTGVNVKVLDVPSYLPFPNLVSLNMSQSGVTRLIGDGFQSLMSLRILDLRGSSMILFPRHLFKGLENLRLVFADNYKLCCEANLPEHFNVNNCEAPFNDVSSCESLLRADVYRVCLSVLAAMSLIGNMGCLWLRSFSLTGRGKTGFNVFVTHLCVSDFVMGVYLAMIGVADRLYLRRYLWEDSRWRHSSACQVAGVLAFLSSEVSAFIICLITLDRFLVIRFPFSQIRFSSFSAQIASLLIWTVGLVLVTLPVLPVAVYRNYYSQTGICVPLPITRNDFHGHKYAFGVMIVLSLVVFLMIAAGQISVYLSMTRSAMNTVDNIRKSRDITVARRLITVVVSDFLCWFPIGLLGILATQGIPVPSEVNVAMAIFVLPINSALNPFLYTLNIVREKRQQAAEAKLLKIILDLGINDNENVSK